jgi:hypothetical protein
MNGNDAIYPMATEGDGFNEGLTKREFIAAMAMKGLLANPEMAHAISRGLIAKMAKSEADNLIHHLSDDPVAEGLNLLPMYSRDLDEGLSDGN